MSKVISDKTGFPLLDVEGLGLVQLWPVTKVQFERFMADVNQFGDRWYEVAVTGNPRVSFRRFDEQHYEGLFMTGVMPHEALAFAKWLGDGFDLPTKEEWRNLYLSVQHEETPEVDMGSLSLPSRCIWESFQSHQSGMGQFSLMDQGLLEWVRVDKTFHLLGTPRTPFHSTVYDPFRQTVRPRDLTLRRHYAGFRLIKRHQNAR